MELGPGIGAPGGGALVDGVRSAGAETLVDRVRLRAAVDGDRRVYTFLAEGGRSEEHVTYAELDAAAERVAAALAATISPGTRALLVYPPGLDFAAAFLGCLYAGVAAVPVYPPFRRTMADRLRHVAEDAGPAAVLAPQGLHDAVSGDLPGRYAGMLLDPTAGDAPSREAFDAPARDDVALIQYSSGSTGTPKGVVISHANLMHNQATIYRAFEHDEESVVVSWLPVYHDMGLIGGLLQPLYAGIPCVLMSPLDFLERPALWLEAITRYRATTSGGPNFAYDYCAARVTAEERSRLDLSSWRVAFNGSEPVRAATLDRFADEFGSAGFRRASFLPCYGLAEATLFVAGAPVAEEPTAVAVSRDALAAGRLERDGGASTRLVSSGRPLHHDVVIAAGEREAREGEVGEILVGGPSVAQGYWQKSDETRLAFGARLLDGRGPFLRTGDLGCIAGGELFVTGRIKDLIIIRGRNVYPQDVEAAAETAHPALRKGAVAAFSVEAAGEERLVVVAEARAGREQEVAGAIAAVASAVADAQAVQPYAVAVVPAGTLSKTSSGKIQRYLARAGVLDGTLPALAWSRPLDELRQQDAEAAPAAPPRREVAAFLRATAAEIAAVPGAFDAEGDDASPGLDSLGALRLKHAVEEHFGVSPALASVVSAATFGALAEVVEAAPAAEHRVAPSAGPEPGDLLPLTPGQRALWLLQKLSPESPAYQIARAVEIGGPLDLPALQAAFERVVARHPMLRAAIVEAHGEPRAKVLAPGSPVTVHDASAMDEAGLRAAVEGEVVRPFAFGEHPLFRVSVFTRGHRSPVMVLAVHHAVADLWSLEVVLRELGLAYEEAVSGPDADLPGLPSIDEAIALRHGAPAVEADELLGRALERLGSTSSGIEHLGSGHAGATSGRGGRIPFGIDRRTSERILELAAARGTTPYVVLLTAFALLLRKLTGRTTLLIGSPVAGRDRAMSAGVVGYFMNVVVAKIDLSGDPTFEEAVDRGARAFTEAVADEALPFPVLAEQLQKARGSARAPVFDALFTFQGASLLEDRGGLVALALEQEDAEVRVGPLVLRHFPVDPKTTQFMLDLGMGAGRDGFVGKVTYDSGVFDEAAARTLVGRWTTLLDQIATAAARPVSQLSILDEGERRRVLVEWNEPPAFEPGPDVLHGLFDRWVSETPAAPAVVTQERVWTFAEIDAAATALAGEVGAASRPDGTVHHSTPLAALMLERGPEFVVGMLAAFKAGCGIVPLCPEYPLERAAMIAGDCSVAVVLADEPRRTAAERVAERVPAARVVAYPGTEALLAGVPSGPDAGLRPAGVDDVAYVVYTSGTTGRPKGVPITHRNVVPLFEWQRQEMGLGPGTRLLQTLSLCFDFGLQEIFTTAFVGGSVYFAPADQVRDPREYAAYLQRHRINAVYATPSFVDGVARTRTPLPTVETLVLGGELLSKRALADIEAVLKPDCVVYNGYGPTEASVNCLMYMARGPRAHDHPEARSVPIGPISARNRVYVLDETGEPVPAGVPGEVYVGGVGVATGYVGRPALTAERFVPDPFSPEAGATMYRTGDVARFLPDGCVEFLGRADEQVKIRGFRVELGEVSAELSQHPSVGSCAVVATEYAKGRRLAAFVAPAVVGGDIDVEDVRAFLKSRLPDYMVPSTFVLMERLPMTANGKVDKSALPSPDAPADERPPAAPPRDDVEREIAEAYGKVLEVGGVGRSDNFFELGGHSLLVPALQTELEQRFGRELAAHLIFDNPTVATLAAFLRDGGVRRPSLRQSEKRREARALQSERQRLAKERRGRRG